MFCVGDSSFKILFSCLVKQIFRSMCSIIRSSDSLCIYRRTSILSKKWKKKGILSFFLSSSLSSSSCSSSSSSSVFFLSSMLLTPIIFIWQSNFRKTLFFSYKTPLIYYISDLTCYFWLSFLFLTSNKKQTEFFLIIGNVFSHVYEYLFMPKSRLHMEMVIIIILYIHTFSIIRKTSTKQEL